MIIRSLENPIYYNRKKTGLAGAELKPKAISNEDKSFEEYLKEAFEGEVVQNGKWFSKNLSQLTLKNLQKI